MKIDLVYTFVNSGDATLAVERHRYAMMEGKTKDEYSAGPARYHGNGELQFAIQSAIRHLPFLRKIYVVHAGVAPAWLSKFGNVIPINQDDILPASIIPVFQSDIVECFIYQIPGLSDRYLYANDDYFFAQNHQLSSFFTSEGLPRIAVCERFAGTGEADPTYRASESNAIRALQKHLRLSQPILVGRGRRLAGLNHPRQQVRAAMKGLRLLNSSTHATQPYRKCHWHDFHQTFQAEITSLCKRRFRSTEGFTINLMYHHYLRALGKAEFYYEPNHSCLDRRHPISQRVELRKALEGSSAVSQFCLNDASSAEEDGWENYVVSLMQGLGYDLQETRQKAGEAAS